MVGIRVLAVVSTSEASQYDAAASVSELASKPHSSNVEVRVLASPSAAEFAAAVGELKPTLLYIGAKADFDTGAGVLAPFAFKDGSALDLGSLAGKGVECLYYDARGDYEAVKACQERGDVLHAVAWPAGAGLPPATLASQFTRCFFSVLFTYGSAPAEAFAMASHVVQAHCTAAGPDGHVSPPLPLFLSAARAELPDNSSIPPLDLPGSDPTQSISSLVPGWSDLRLLAPRAEVRLLLTGNASLVDSHKLTFLGEALRALLIMETRTVTLVSTSLCTKVPVNLASGCGAIRCELRTASGRSAVVVLGGQPPVLKDTKLVEHSLRMTLVSDSQSLQFRLPPPGVSVPPPRVSAAIAGGTPVVDTLVLSSVWAVQVLRGLCEDAASLGLISMGVAAVGASATAGLSPADVQRLKMLVSGEGPAEHPLVPLGGGMGGVGMGGLGVGGGMGVDGMMGMGSGGLGLGLVSEPLKEEMMLGMDAPPPPPPALASTAFGGAMGGMGGDGAADGDEGDEGGAPPPPPLAPSLPEPTPVAQQQQHAAADNGNGHSHDDAMDTDAAPLPPSLEPVPVPACEPAQVPVSEPAAASGHAAPTPSADAVPMQMDAA
ncbi:hypothetical protein FOA52_007975 [Chlamydomonas sp. UWO 241]|nr:hypothetical protein FOA52_007975 [Chlamydomonas sp. UWO 241]